jgi:hypothetical protein
MNLRGVVFEYIENTRDQKTLSTKKEKNNLLHKKLNPEREKEKECYSKDNILLWMCEKIR